MSNHPCHHGSMRHQRIYKLPLRTLVFHTTTIARSAPASLVRHLDGRHKLSGGIRAGQAAARDWVSLFAPEVVSSATVRPAYATARGE